MGQFSLVLVLCCASIFIKQGNSEVTTPTKEDDQPQDSEPNYPPFMVLLDREKSSTKPGDFIIPSSYTNTDKGLSLAGDKPDLEEISLCPDPRSIDESLQEDLHLLHGLIPSTKRCLFVAKFQENEKQMCEKEPTPWLTIPLETTGTEFVCGTHNTQRLINAEYYNCGTEEHFIEYAQKAKAIIEANQSQEIPPFLMNFYIMFEICFDFKNKKTVWTRHQVLGPKLLTHKDYPHKDLNTVSLAEFSTETFDLELDLGTFVKMKQPYEPIIPNNKTDPLYPNMEIYPLVPKDHMALPYWKKSIDHMINSGPILPKFIPLMKTIHRGILLASNYYLRESHQILTMFTKADTVNSIKHNVTSALNLKPMIASIMPETSTDVFRPTMWYIAVLNEDDQSGILIVLHNTKEALPATKECDDKMMLCDIKSWAEDPGSINENDLKYAYCCPINQEKLKKLFSINWKIKLSIQKNLNLQEVISLEKHKLLFKTVVDELEKKISTRVQNSKEESE
ncbi:uncharacterized protein LOC135833688 [Planococcus citri]|uniref:uncharacterized protein LOC135833688 n=1 Tax=Planococcus citri TaxID=170843 RepID=UPI0031F9CE20